MQIHKFSSYIDIYFSQTQIQNFVRLASCQFIIYNRIPYLHTALTLLSAQNVAFNVYMSQILTVFLHIMPSLDGTKFKIWLQKCQWSVSA